MMIPKGMQGRMSSPHKKYLDVTRWMGCKIAVYDLTVQAKASTRGESSRSVAMSKAAKRGTKRRGCRRGQKGVRKCRTTSSADPVLSRRLIPLSELMTYGPKLRRRVQRQDYLQTRFESYVWRNVRETVRLEQILMKINPIHRPKPAIALTAQVKNRTRRLVELVSRYTGSSLWMTMIRVSTLITAMGGTERTVNFRGTRVPTAGVLETFMDFVEIKGLPPLLIGCASLAEAKENKLAKPKWYTHVDFTSWTRDSHLESLSQGSSRETTRSGASPATLPGAKAKRNLRRR